VIEILAGVRTPIGKFGGTLRPLRARDIGAHAVRETLGRVAIDPTAVDLAVVGLARQAGNGPNPGRLIAVGGGLPYTTPAFTVQQACLSGMLAVISGTQAIETGAAQVVVAGGVEHMSSVPHLSFDMRWGTRMGTAELVDAMFADGFIDPMCGKHMGKLCDELAARYGITREEQDAYALESQQRWAKARAAHADDAIISAVPKNDKGGDTLLAIDENPRTDSTLEGLAKLRPAFDPAGTVTPGNACGLADGAAAVMFASSDAARKLGIRPRARILGSAIAAIAPGDYAIAPVASTRKLLQALDMQIDQFDFVEINEAFAAQMLACIRDLELDRSRVNVWGGAIAVGHPIGMSGIRVLLNAVHQLEVLGGRYALAAICGNGGQGASIAIERV
jgi:acetyl-CoA C-acetyltransferase